MTTQAGGGLKRFCYALEISGPSLGLGHNERGKYQLSSTETNTKYTKYSYV